MQSFLMDKNTFLKQLDRIPDLPTLPAVALTVNKMLMNEDVSVRKLSEVIEKDHAMVSKLLRLVNSSFYGFQSKIDNISHAITILGFSTVRNAVLSISVVQAFSSKEAFEEFSLSDFWKHSVAVAVTGRRLAQRSRLGVPDEAFVAGILHDMGKLVLARHFRDMSRNVWIAVADEGLSFHDAEKNCLPVDHACIGGALARKWHLPEKLVDAITNHHCDGTFRENFNTTMIVHASDFLANRYWPTVKNSENIAVIAPQAAEALGAELNTAGEWFPSAASEIEHACGFFMDSTD